MSKKNVMLSATKWSRSISLASLNEVVLLIELLLHARCFGKLSMTFF
jgi:hypothetical protein